MTDTVHIPKAKSRSRRNKARSRRRLKARAANAAVHAPSNDTLDPARNARAPDALAGAAGVFGGDGLEHDDPPFDPPDADDILGLANLEDDDPPFDPPTTDDIVGAARLEASGPHSVDQGAALEPAGELLLVAATEPCDASRRLPAPASARAPCAEGRLTEQPVPPINIHASWDRPEIANLLTGFAADRRMSRAEISVERGGLDSAIIRFAAQASPNLLILDTTLTGAQMLNGLDRLAGVMEQGAKIIIIGAVNDIGLFRELAARGVSEYIVPPVRQDDLVRAVCRLYADTDKSRVIALIGARGGVGASTIAHNLAWSIAERQDVAAALLDLDLSFGTAAFNVNLDSPGSIADLLLAPEHIDDTLLERVTANQTSRLRILTAPATLEREFKLDPQTLETLISRARRTSAFVILDLPHAWNPWVKQTLLNADDVIIVAGPDLASLSSAKNMLDLLKAARAHESAPVVVLSMVGVPGRPEILIKEYAEALGAEPVASFAFDPALFGICAIKSQMIGEAAPLSKAALALDALATRLTGRAPAEHKKAASRPSLLAASAPAADAPDSETHGEVPAARSEALGVREPAHPLHLQSELQLAFPSAPASADAQVAAQGEAAPLDLVDQAPTPRPNDYLAKARGAAEAELDALRNPRREPGVGRRRLGRLAGAAASLMVVLGGAWGIQTHGEATDAAEPQRAARSRAEIVLEQATLSGDLTASYERALQLIHGGSIQEGVTLLRRAAESGFPMAQYRLAKLYGRGEGVAADLTIARRWTERAATAGNRRAMHDLGVFFAHGEGGPTDEAAAFRWFRQAAQFGIADSQYNLGVFYQRGRGVSADAAEALFWFLLAARQGDEAAAARAAGVEAHLSLLQIEQARARALAFRPRAANSVANGAFGPRTLAEGAASYERL